ncbi:MAG: hypothetical protein VB857_11820 [Pirellulaceae bacterium]
MELVIKISIVLGGLMTAAADFVLLERRIAARGSDLAPNRNYGKDRPGCGQYQERAVRTSLPGRRDRVNQFIQPDRPQPERDDLRQGKTTERLRPDQGE